MRKKVKFYYTSGDAKKLARATTYKVSFQHGYMFFFFCLFATRNPRNPLWAKSSLFPGTWAWNPESGDGV